MPWWGWLLAGLAITGIPLLALLAYFIHLMAHMFDGF